MHVSPTFHVSLLRPVIPGPRSAPTDPPGSVTVNGAPAYQLPNSRRNVGRLQYLVDWEGYGPKEQCWVPVADILDPSLVADFHRSHPGRPERRGAGTLQCTVDPYPCGSASVLNSHHTRIKTILLRIKLLLQFNFSTLAYHPVGVAFNVQNVHKIK